MMRRYTFEQAEQRLQVDGAELKFLYHHFREFLSSSKIDAPFGIFTDQDMNILSRANDLRKNEGRDPIEIRKLLRDELYGQMSGRCQPQMFAFCSGREGAGKSTILWNLASALAAKEQRCVLFDASLESGGLDHFCRFADDENSWHQDLPNGIRLVSAARAAHIDAAEVDGQIAELEQASDFVFVDTGSESAQDMLSFASIVDEIVTVSATDVGANADCFALIRMLKGVDPNLRISILINHATNVGDARQALARINGAARKMGMPELPGLGWIASDEALRKCTAARETIIDALPTSISAKCIAHLADHLINCLTPRNRRGDNGMVDLMNSFRQIALRGAPTPITLK